MANYYTDHPELEFHLHHPLMKRIVELKERNFEDKDKYADAPVDYEDAIENYNRILDITGDVAANIIEPNSEAVDLEGPHLENGRMITDLHQRHIGGLALHARTGRCRRCARLVEVVVAREHRPQIGGEPEGTHGDPRLVELAQLHQSHVLGVDGMRLVQRRTGTDDGRLAGVLGPRFDPRL